MGYEIAPSFSISSMQINSKNIEPLLTYEFMDATTSTPAAITDWGGYSIGEAFMVNINNENIWVINPFEFFKKALRLQTLIVPDVTTENGKRLLFSHVDGDGIMNRVEGESERFSGEVILEEVLKKYKIPHSVSVIGAEIDKNGLYPELSEKLQSIAKEFYKLDNVEGATHTFTHPFIWAKIKNDSLDEKYRLKPKGYQFSLKHELSDSLEFINKELSPPMKKNSDVVFWSGDCSPRVNALDYVYSHDILNINRGDTTITRSSPWMSTIAPLGIKRGDYYQVYTGAQNENVFTNDWLGPFWGFKRVVQTFELTNSPRRFKPIDVYYHLYSGSKKASREALAYVFDWAVKQDVMPIFTSEYIPKVMDYYEVSMAQDGEDWLVEGMRDLRTLRVEERDASVDFNKSKSTIGVKHFENHAYLSLDASERHFLTLDNNDSHEKRSHMISANAKITDYLNEENHQRITFEGHVDLKLDFYLAPECKLESSPKAKSQSKDGETLSLSYKKGVTKAVIEISCD